MVACIVFHSARSGVGKSTLAANVAALLARRGRRVGVIDANLQDGGMAHFYSLATATVGDTLNDFLLERCDGSSALYDVTPPQVADGRILLMPASARPRELSAVIQQGFRVERVTDDLLLLAERMGLDALLIDTHAGLQEQTLVPMLTLAIAKTLVIVLRLDQGDYQGTGVTVDVARTLKIPRIALVANQIAAAFDPAHVQQELEQAYACEVLGLLPYTPAVAALGSAGLFVLQYPDHPAAPLYEQLAEALIQRPDTVTR